VPMPHAPHSQSASRQIDHLGIEIHISLGSFWRILTELPLLDVPGSSQPPAMHPLKFIFFCDTPSLWLLSHEWLGVSVNVSVHIVKHNLSLSVREPRDHSRVPTPAGRGFNATFGSHSPPLLLARWPANEFNMSTLFSPLGALVFDVHFMGMPFLFSHLAWQDVLDGASPLDSHPLH
jgi:hypothetical protein